MIKLKQPSLILHSPDVPGYKYTSWRSWLMKKNANIRDLVYWINYALDESPEGYLHNVVINCHGSPGYLHIGGVWKGFGNSETNFLRPLRTRGAVGRIFLVACKVAGESTDSKHLGKVFCSNIAKESGTPVIASDTTQSVDIWYEHFSHPYGTIDDYEGSVFEFSPGGGSSRWSD